jgi:hypothetical protein
MRSQNAKWYWQRKEGKSWRSTKRMQSNPLYKVRMESVSSTLWERGEEEEEVEVEEEEDEEEEQEEEECTKRVQKEYKSV